MNERRARRSGVREDSGSVIRRCDPRAAAPRDHQVDILTAVSGLPRSSCWKQRWLRLSVFISAAARPTRRRLDTLVRREVRSHLLTCSPVRRSHRLGGKKYADVATRVLSELTARPQPSTACVI